MNVSIQVRTASRLVGSVFSSRSVGVLLLIPMLDRSSLLPLSLCNQWSYVYFFFITMTYDILWKCLGFKFHKYLVEQTSLRSNPSHITNKTWSRQVKNNSRHATNKTWSKQVSRIFPAMSRNYVSNVQHKKKDNNICNSKILRLLI